MTNNLNYYHPNEGASLKTSNFKSVKEPVPFVHKSWRNVTTCLHNQCQRFPVHIDLTCSFSSNFWVALSFYLLNPYLFSTTPCLPSPKKIATGPLPCRKWLGKDCTIIVTVITFSKTFRNTGFTVGVQRLFTTTVRSYLVCKSLKTLSAHNDFHVETCGETRNHMGTFAKSRKLWEIGTIWEHLWNLGN